MKSWKSSSQLSSGRGGICGAGTGEVVGGEFGAGPSASERPPSNARVMVLRRAGAVDARASDKDSGGVVEGGTSTGSDTGGTGAGEGETWEIESDTKG